MLVWENMIDNGTFIMVIDSMMLTGFIGVFVLSTGKSGLCSSCI